MSGEETDSRTPFGPMRASVPADRAAIAEAIGKAFFDDPIAIYLFPDEAKRRSGFGRFSGLAMDQFQASGETTVLDPIQGAAIWQAPNPVSLGAWTQLLFAFRFFLVTGRDIGRAIRLSEVMDANHYKKPHWYLAILGVEPDAQGKGLGGALMQPILDRCDQDRIDAYLESSKESNIPFYQRFGFEVTGEIDVPDGPRLWPMVRPPR